MVKMTSREAFLAVGRAAIYLQTGHLPRNQTFDEMNEAFVAGLKVVRTLQENGDDIDAKVMTKDEVDGILSRIEEETDRVRCQYHLTLGALIDELHGLETAGHGDCPVITDHRGYYPGEEDSYRGYYSDLAFEPTSKPTTIDSVLVRCRASLHRPYTCLLYTSPSPRDS